MRSKFIREEDGGKKTDLTGRICGALGVPTTLAVLPVALFVEAYERTVYHFINRKREGDLLECEAKGLTLRCIDCIKTLGYTAIKGRLPEYSP